jgi:hypothetical protein
MPSLYLKLGSTKFFFWHGLGLKNMIYIPICQKIAPSEISHLSKWKLHLSISLGQKLQVILNTFVYMWSHLYIYRSESPSCLTILCSLLMILPASVLGSFQVILNGAPRITIFKRKSLSDTINPLFQTIQWFPLSLSIRIGQSLWWPILSCPLPTFSSLLIELQPNWPYCLSPISQEFSHLVIAVFLPQIFAYANSSFLSNLCSNITSK